MAIARGENINLGKQGSDGGTLMGRATSSKIGFLGTTPIPIFTLTGSKGANAALTSVIALLVAYGIAIDTTS